MKETTALTMANAIVQLSDFSLWTSPILRLRWRWCMWRTAAEGMHDMKAQTPERRIKVVFILGYTVEPACKVHGCKVFLDVRSIFGWSQSKYAIMSYNPDIRSARL